ncbi:Ribonuclease HII [Geodia barretti]|uniref:Ribonuclease n=1 Tax=Geodia barretti TaxID=519541 RepID=A0AA35TYK2_GEOBA|nr:Ribonuclease HII [Geodia barretti]
MPDLSLEADFRARGFQLIAGVDEAGRGPLAGPVAAAAVILPPGVSGVDDSKRLSPARRESAAVAIRRYALAWSVAQVSSREIDHIGIGPAVVQAMMAAVSGLRPPPDGLLLDWVHIKDCDLPYQRIVKGDQKSLSIAAASILAKVSRDREMESAALLYPGYGFASHKGYATADHLRRLADRGPCPIHRRSFHPLNGAPRRDWTTAPAAHSRGSA